MIELIQSLGIFFIPTVICWFFITIFLIFNSINKRLKRKDTFLRFAEIFAIFESSKDVAYNKLFRTDILTYSSSGFRINKEEMEKFQREYVKLVFKCCGPKITEDLEEIHGDLESIGILLINEFISKVEQDETTITEAVRNQEETKIDENEE